MDSNSPVEEENQPSTPKLSKRILRTALMMGGSALLGGLTVAIFNRKQIASMRQAQANSPQPVPKPPEEEEV